MDVVELRNQFKYHPPRNEADVRAHEATRDHCLDLAEILNDYLPECDEKKEAIRHVRKAMFWANAALACHR